MLAGQTPESLSICGIAFVWRFVRFGERPLRERVPPTPVVSEHIGSSY